ncbi:TlpA family protein disulfide reductase [Candidatus Bipolaricaulota bacterium]
MSCRTLVSLLVVSILGVMPAACYEGQLNYFEDTTGVTSGCFPQWVRLESAPPEGFTWPEQQGESIYGLIPVGDGAYPVMIDQRTDGYDLYVDADLAGNLQRYAWERFLSDGSLLASLPLALQYPDNQTASYQVFLIWSRSAPTTLTFCRDSYRAGRVQLADDVYTLVVFDENSDGRYDDLDSGTLLIDADGNGELLFSSDSHEVFSLDQPFNLGGIVYEVATMTPDGSGIEIVESDIYVDPKFPLLEGFPAPTFGSIDSVGNDFSLEALHGDIVVLDFWASWCGPCIYELPTFESIADEFARNGVRVIGINLDRLEDDFHSAVERYAISYRQIYDSGSGPIADLYRIQGIPMTYIIDRDGIIHARGLRGENLITRIREFIESES